jgi:hypothetical protein
MGVRERWIMFMAALATLAAAQAMAAPSPFDRPLRVVRVPLPRDADNPSARARVSCFYFPRFMVKEVDLGEVGAEQLSIVPAPDQSRAPVCQRANRPGEHVVPMTAWSGYFDGVKADYIVFSAGDGWNGGMGFAVFDARTGAKLFDDAAKGEFRAMVAAPDSLTLRYRRVFAAKCSVAASASCWKQIEADTGLSAAPPPCAAAYAHEARRTPKLAKEVRNDPTVVEYDIVATVGAPNLAIRPATGRAAACAPAE